jgi:hypothetical protein
MECEKTRIDPDGRLLWKPKPLSFLSRHYNLISFWLKSVASCSVTCFYVHVRTWWCAEVSNLGGPYSSVVRFNLAHVVLNTRDISVYQRC